MGRLHERGVLLLALIKTLPVPTFRGRGRRLGPAGTLLLALLVACTPRGKKAEGPRFERAPVILISVDTLRSDRLPMYGYQKVKTPALDGLRQDSILFEKAYSHIPLTLPAHVSLFTGLEPGQHGVLDNSGYRLDPSHPTIAELVKKSGYRTAGAVSAVVLGSQSGVARGFDFYDDNIGAKNRQEMLDFVQRPGKATAESLLSWIRQNSAGPFLAFLHTYEPHAPYDAPEPFKSSYADPYDAEVACSDEIVGEFLGELKKSGVYDRAIIMFLSDHGEGLGDHGEMQHGIFLYRESIQVPLLLKLPSSMKAGARVPAPVQLTDVFTTLGELLGLADFPSRPGTVSLSALAAGAPPPARRIFAENFNPRIRLGWSELRSLISERHQYIEAPTPEFYDLVNDFAEKENLAPKKPEELRSMVAEMEKRRTALKPPSPIGPEEAKKLQSLGYLTGAPSEVGGPLPDPKDAIGSLVQLQAAAELHQGGKSAEAIPILRSILEKNPRLVDGWEILANAHERLGQLEEAVAAQKMTARLSPPGRTNYMVDVANLSLRAGHLAEARQNAELAFNLGDPRAAEVLARVSLAEKDLPAARRWAQTALEKKTAASEAGLVLARVAMLEGKLPEALQTTDALLGTLGSGLPPPGLHVLRAEILGRQEKLDQAEVEYRKELSFYPRSLDALGGLAIVAAARGDLNEASRRIDSMLRSVPSPDAYRLAFVSLRSFGNMARARSVLAEARARYPGDKKFSREAVGD